MKLLDDIKKKIFNTASADQEKEVTEMTAQEQQPTAANEQLAEMAAALATATETQAAMQEQMAELQSKYDLATAALAASAEAQAALVAAAEAKVQAERTAKLSAIMGDVKGPQTAASLSALNDEAFEVVLASYAANYEAEANSEMFTEKGVAAEAAPVEEVDAVQRLAATLAAQFKTKQ